MQNKNKSNLNAGFNNFCSNNLPSKHANKLQLSGLSEVNIYKILHFSQQEQQPVETRQTVHHEIHIQSTSPPDSRPPRLVSPFNDAQVEEGQRFEFKVRVGNWFGKFCTKIFRLMAHQNRKLNGQKMGVTFEETVTTVLRF
jgi:hypothetical protein